MSLSIHLFFCLSICSCMCLFVSLCSYLSVHNLHYNVHIFVYLFMYMFVHVTNIYFVYSFICLSLYKSMFNLSLCPSVSLYIHFPVCLYICQYESASLSIYLRLIIYLFVYLCTYPSVYLSGPVCIYNCQSVFMSISFKTSAYISI